MLGGVPLGHCMGGVIWSTSFLWPSQQPLHCSDIIPASLLWLLNRKQGSYLLSRKYVFVRLGAILKPYTLNNSLPQTQRLNATS